MDKKIYLVFLIVFISLAIRLYSLNYGLPYIVGPDEKRQVLDALSMAARHSLVPLEYTYPALHKYLLLFCFSIYFLIGIIIRTFANTQDFILKFLVDPGKIFLIARLLSIVFGIALSVPVYLFSKTFFSKNVAIITSIFTMFMFNLVVHSQWAISDIILCFFSTFAFYYIIRCMIFSTTKDFIITGIFIGLAVATKYQGIYLVAPFLAMLILNAKTFFCKKIIFKNIILSFLMITVFISSGNLSFIFNFKDSFARFVELKDEMMGISSFQPFAHNFISVVAWFTKEMARQETFLGIILLLGILYSLYKHSKIDLIFLSYLFICLLSLVNFGFRFLHLLVYIFAIICIFGARFMEELMQMIFKLKYRFLYSLVLASIIVLPSITTGIYSDIKRSNPDTRILAKVWIEQNIPFGSNIAEDWYDFSVPLQSDFPFLFQEDKVKAYYIRYFDENTRKRYKDYAGAKGAYDLVQVRYEIENPAWPQDMPKEAIERAERIPLVRRLYKWFNFRSIEELKKMGVSYVIISSYAYNHFLLDNDPRKRTGLFNPFILEDTLRSNRQARYYNKNSKYGLLFYLAKKGRDFYLPLLNLEDSRIKLVKEICPDKRNLGPVIKIYQLKY